MSKTNTPTFLCITERKPSHNCYGENAIECLIHAGTIDNPGNAVASVGLGGLGGGSSDPKDVRALARLIAAAPDLLDSVEHAVGFISAICELCEIEDDITLDARRKDTGESYKLRLSEIIQSATDALAKAYGTDALATLDQPE